MPRTEVKIEWLRTTSGSVLHACLPDWLHSVGSRGGPHRWALCGRVVYPNREVEVRLVGARVYTTDPARLKQCSKCVEVLAELTFTTTKSRLDLLNNAWEKIGRRRSKDRHKERIKQYGKNCATQVMFPRAQKREVEALGGRVGSDCS